MEQSALPDILTNEHLLVAQAKTDNSAFEALYHHYFPKIYGYVFKRCGNRATTEDIVSSVFLKVFAGLGAYERRNHTFGAWVYKIATNELIDYYRKQGRRPQAPLEQAESHADNAESAAEAVQRGQDAERIRGIINNLPERYQRVLHLKFFADFSYMEIAQTLKISENNARVLLHRALKRFKKQYESF